VQKAFDTVNYDILLYKLYTYGIHGIAHEWFSSYLNSRKQNTVAGGVSSCTLDINCGVPEGSVLGPLLFLIYVNDIANANPDESVKLFADNTNLFIARKNPRKQLLSLVTSLIHCTNGSLPTDLV